MLPTGKYRLPLLVISTILLTIGVVIAQLKLSRTPATPINTVATIPPNPTPTTQPIIQSQRLYGLINALRVEHELPELVPNPKLEASAALKLADMLEKHYYRHEDTAGQESWHLFKQVNYQYIAAGENLAFNLNTEWNILAWWQQSPKHEAQLLNPQFSDMGLAIDCQALAEYQDGGCITVLHLGSE